MTKVLALLALVLSFQTARAASSDAQEVANALVRIAHVGTEFKTFVDNTTDVTDVEVDDHGNGAATIRVSGHYRNIDMVCGSSELVIERTVVNSFFGPTTVYRPTETHKKFCR